MNIQGIKFYATSGRNIDGKRRPTSFLPHLDVDALPPMDAPYRAVKRPSGTLYFREQRGRAEFFLHTPSDESGFGGAWFSGVLEDGTPFRVKGPWSSGCTTVNSIPGLASEPLADVAVRELEGEYPTLYQSSHLGLRLLREIEAAAQPHWTLAVPQSFAAVPGRNADLSDEQLAVVLDGERPERLAFLPTRDFEDCVGCAGAGRIVVGACAECGGSGTHRADSKYNCWKCSGSGRKYEMCSTCGKRFCSAGIAPYPLLLLS